MVMKKIIIVLINLLSFSCLLHGMELEDLNKKEEKPSATGMHLDLGSLNNGQNVSIPSGATKTPITGMHEVDTLLKARSVIQTTSRSSRSGKETSSTLRNRRLKVEVNPDQVAIDLTGTDDAEKMTVNDLAPKTIPNGLEELLDNKNDFDEQESRDWKILQLVNRPVYDFAQSRGKSLEEAIVYAELLQAFNIRPQFVVEHVEQINALEKKTPTAYKVKHYADLEKENSDQYAEIALGVLDELFAQRDGQKNPVPTQHKEHTVAQDNKITEQDWSLKKFKIGTFVHCVITFATIGWGLYAQIYNAVGPHAGGNCTG